MFDARLFLQLLGFQLVVSQLAIRSHGQFVQPQAGHWASSQSGATGGLAADTAASRCQEEVPENGEDSSQTVVYPKAVEPSGQVVGSEGEQEETT